MKTKVYSYDFNNTSEQPVGENYLLYDSVEDIYV